MTTATRVATVVLATLLGTGAVDGAGTDRIDLNLDTSEADAVLAIVEKYLSDIPVTSGDWEHLFATEPYRRLKEREAGMNRAFTDEWFQAFVKSDTLAAQAPELRQTLDAWRSRDLEASAERILAYLPPEARIRATVYPVIKPQTNTFVFDLHGDPAIFYYVDTSEPAAKFENTVAHELHHIGFASIADVSDSTLAALPANVRTAVDWMGAFGEGFAMLAAAGDVETHPHATSTEEERAQWDRDMTHADDDLHALERFFLDVIDGHLTDPDEIRARAFSFYGTQGPWYTVGYRMAAAVERRYGRDTLIACMKDPRQLLARFNAAVEETAEGDSTPATWSPRLLHAIGVR